MIEKNTHIHFIGICGVAMSALAVAFHKQGYRVTGSDKGFYPPVSTLLEEEGIQYYPGWHPEQMMAEGHPAMVIVGNVASSKNPEWLAVQENNIPYFSYPEAIAKFFVKQTSIVCAGTYGKTTSTSLLTWITQHAGINPSYMFGGISQNGIPAAALNNSDYSILEGDEYKSARWDNQAKFFHYAPTHLLLTSVVWDHADVYKTEQSYIQAFETLVSSLPKNGYLVVSEKVLKDTPEVVSNVQATLISYGTSPSLHFSYKQVTTHPDGVRFTLVHNNQEYPIHTSELGEYMADNITGCVAMAYTLGIPIAQSIASITSFRSIKRRLEKRFSREVQVFDDIAHSPQKAEAVLSSIKQITTGTLIAVFEPNTGNRQTEAIAGYDHRFDAADRLIIPRLSTIKQQDGEPPAMDGNLLQTVIQKTHAGVQYIEDDSVLIETLVEQSTPGDTIIFLGSHGFRGMIEAVVEGLEKKYPIT